jgi:hypothetical protein
MFFTLPVYNYESSDGWFDDIEIPWKGRTLRTVEINFESYKSRTNKPDLKIYRTSKRIWRAPNLWIDNLTNRRWQVPFSEPSTPHKNKYDAKAKRREPKDVDPVTYGCVKYVAPHFKMIGDQIQHGFVEAWHITSNKKLWELQIYKVTPDPRLEKDIQDVFITSLAINGKHLIVINERNERYEVDLKTKKIRVIK